MKNDFSVVITTKDRIDFLKRCVNSIFSNTILPRKVIIVNDGGEDIDDYLFDFNHQRVDLIIVNNSQSMGANYCRNYGVSISSTEFVFLIDDDDAFTENSFESRINAFLSDDKVGLVYTGFHTVYSDNLTTIVSTNKQNKQYNSIAKALLNDGNIIGSTSRVALRVKDFFEVGGFDENLLSVQDYDMWIRLSRVTKVVHDNNVGILYTIHKGSSSQVSSNYGKYLNSAEYLIDKYNNANICNSDLNALRSNLYLRVAIAGANNLKVKYIYCAKSLGYRFRATTLAFMLIPTTILRKFKDFI